MQDLAKWNNANRLNTFGNVFLEIQPIKNLFIKSNFGADNATYLNKIITPTFTEGALSRTSNSLFFDQNHYLSTTLSNTIRYNLDLNANNHFKFLVGTEYVKTFTDFQTTKKEGFALQTEDYFTLNAGTGNTTVTGASLGNRLLSEFGRLDYNYSGKYLASVTVRRDGSSRFGTDNQYGIFPAASAGWRIDKEGFMKNNGIFSELKTRLGVGRVGNQEIGDLSRFALYDTRYGTTQNQLTPGFWEQYMNIGTAYSLTGANTGSLPSGFVQTQAANPGLKWETTDEINAGLDFTIFNDKISGSFDYFTRKTTGILITPPVASALGEGQSKTVNGASKSNKGWEFIVSYHGQQRGDFNYNVTLNFSHFRDKITNLPENVRPAYGTGIGGARPTTQAEAQSMGNLSWGAKYDGVPTVQYDGVLRPYSPDKNRISEFYRTGTTLTNSIALSGGNTSTNFRTSFSNQDALGISPDNSYHRKIFNMGLNSQITPQLTLQVNINYTHEENKNPPLVGAQGVGFSSFLNRTPLTLAIQTLKDNAVGPDGSIYATNPFGALLTNPYYLIGRMFNDTKRDHFLGTVLARYDFTKWLYLQGRVNADMGYAVNDFNFPHGITTLRNSSNTGWAGTYNVNTGFNRQMNMDFLLGTHHKIGDFTIDGSVGGNMYTFDSNLSTQGVTDFVVRDVYSIANGITKTQDFGVTRTQVNSAYGFADFGYKNYLYLSVTDRVDYFSVLTPPSSIVANPKVSINYPSAGLSFVFSELLHNISWLNYGKLRMSYAVAGNANGVPAYNSQLTYSIASQLFGTYPVGSIANADRPNPLLTPALITEKEIGMELKTLNNRLNFDIAVYDKRTDKQILPVALSPASGYTSTNVNIAKLKNTGLEVLVDGTPVKTRNFAWNIAVNTAYNTSKVLALNPGQTRQLVVFFNGTGNEFLGSLVYDVGKEMNQLISYTYLRNAAGQVMLNAQGRLIHSVNQVNYGSANAKVTGGVENTFRYKALSLLVQIDGKFGGKVFSSTALNGLRSGMSQKSLVGRSGVVFDGVLPDGSKNTISVDPRIFYADYRTQQIADPFVFSSDFIKLRNITFNYDFTSLLSKNVKFIKGLSLAAFCRNAAVLMKRIPDVDPEAFASSGDSRLGYEQHTEPTTRTFGLNLNVKF